MDLIMGFSSAMMETEMMEMAVPVPVQSSQAIYVLSPL